MFYSNLPEIYKDIRLGNTNEVLGKLNRLPAGYNLNVSVYRSFDPGGIITLKTLLTEACERGNGRVIEKLLSMGMKPTERDFIRLIAPNGAGQKDANFGNLIKKLINAGALSANNGKIIPQSNLAIALDHLSYMGNVFSCDFLATPERNDTGEYHRFHQLISVINTYRWAGHRFGISNEFLSGESSNQPFVYGVKTSIEGMKYPRAYHESLSVFYNFVGNMKDEIRETIKAAIPANVNYGGVVDKVADDIIKDFDAEKIYESNFHAQKELINRNYSAIKSRLLAGECISIPTISVYPKGGRHAHGFVLTKDKIYHIDRGGANIVGISASDYNISDLNVWEFLRDSVIDPEDVSWRSKVVKKDFFDNMLNKSGLFNMEKFFDMKQQKTGNCTWASSKAMLFVQIYNRVMKETNNIDNIHPGEKEKLAKSIAKDIYKYFTLYDRMKFYKSDDFKLITDERFRFAITKKIVERDQKLINSGLNWYEKIEHEIGGIGISRTINNTVIAEKIKAPVVPNTLDYVVRAYIKNNQNNPALSLFYDPGSRMEYTLQYANGKLFFNNTRIDPITLLAVPEKAPVPISDYPAKSVSSSFTGPPSHHIHSTLSPPPATIGFSPAPTAQQYFPVAPKYVQQSPAKTPIRTIPVVTNNSARK